MTFYEKLFKLISHLKLSLQITTTTTTNPYPTKWGQLHGSNDVIVFYHKPNLDPTHWTSKSFLNGFSNSFPRSSSTSFNLTLLHLIYSSYYDIYGSSLYMPKPSKPIFYYRCSPHSLSNGVIPNPIMSSLTTHPAQHPHLCYTYLILVLTLNRPTLRTIQHCRSDCCPIELPSINSKPQVCITRCSRLQCYVTQLFVINLQPQMQLLKPYSCSLIKNANIILNNKILVLNQYTITNVELIIKINK